RGIKLQALPMNRTRKSLQMNEAFRGGSLALRRSGGNRELSMYRRFGVPALAGSDRLKAGHQANFAPQPVSCSQCMRKTERGLSKNQKVGRVSPLRAVCALP